jgi:hypothetical protein
MTMGKPKTDARVSAEVSSMPKKPAIRGKTWTLAAKNRLLGMMVEIGYIDGPPRIALVIDAQDGDSFFCPRIFIPGENTISSIDGPDQVIRIWVHQFKVPKDIDERYKK